MIKRSLVILSVVFGMVILFLPGCKKNNHDTLVPLGDEHYMKSMDDIYPRQYRFKWPAIDQSGYYSLSIIGADTTLLPQMNEGVFPPDMTGEYLIKGYRTGGDETMHYNGSDINIYGPTVDGMNVYFRIKDQKNGAGRVYLREYNRFVTAEIPETDSVYIYGNGNTGEFTRCFEGVISRGSVGSQKYAYIISGTLGYEVINGDTVQGIKNVKRWHVVKGKSDGLPYYMNIGGQRIYQDSTAFSRKVEYGWGFENE